MNAVDLSRIAQEIVSEATMLKDRHTDQRGVPVNYAAIFTHDQRQFSEYKQAASMIGTVVKETPTGPLYHIRLVNTAAGPLRLLKVRAPDETRPERGDADFTVIDYPSFKAKYLRQPGFSLIERETMEMIELIETGADVRVYFSDPPLDQQLGLV